VTRSHEKYVIARRAILKQIDSAISRLICEFFAFATSSTVSHNETAVLMVAFGNVRFM
jgi:hypothetical protein